MPATTDTARPRTGGFTIVELLVTVTVMALLAVVAMPASSVSHKRNLDMLQMQLQDAIDHAQSISYHTGERAGVFVHRQQQWFAVINELGTPYEDPLTHKPYVIKVNAPGSEQGVNIDEFAFGFGRALILFNDKGRLIYPGVCRITSGNVTRNLEVTTATALLTEVPIAE